MTKTSVFNDGGASFQILASTMNKAMIVGVVGVILGGVYLAYQSAGPDAPVAAGKSPGAASVMKPLAAQKASAAHTEQASLPAFLPPAASHHSTLESAAKQGILEAIHTASISYDPAELPRIQPFLTHPDPEVRAAALNGMIVLGHASGAPLLRDAAKRTANPLEAAELLKKADYLELPSMPIEILRQRLKKRPSKVTPGAGAKSP
jgi:hypothetical protein